MKTSKPPIPLLLLSFVFCALCLPRAGAALVIHVHKAQAYSRTTLIKMDLQNTFTNTIESARAVVFLLDDKGKVVGQQARWILGGTKQQPGLAPDANTKFFFTVPTRKSFTDTRVIVSRVILEGGKLANPLKDVKIEKVNE
jgi:hypothetical protein